MSIAYLGLGSNLGDRGQQIANALQRLERPETKMLRVSSIYQSAPLGPVADQPLFFNAVAEVQTCLAPGRLLERMLAVEDAMKRERTVHQGPRTIDLDLLLFDDVVARWPELTLPHPRFHQRAFVLRPLLELCPELIDPKSGAKVATMLPATAGQAITRVGALQLRWTAENELAI